MMTDLGQQRQFIRELQEQYGTLWRATESYIDGGMPKAQQAKLEVACPEFIAIVSRQRLEVVLASLLAQQDTRLAALEAAAKK